MVFSCILEQYPTGAIEKNMNPGATLAGDLQLSREQINVVGFTVERELQYLGLPALTDAQILSWVKVQDIIDTVAEIAG